MISYFPVVTGSLTVSGSVNISGGITASGGISISGSIASASFASTASFVALAQSASNAVSAATASYADTLTVAGNLTAQTLVVQTITSSVDFVTGSTRFGSILGNTHVFSGSVTMNPGGLFVTSSGLVGIGTTSPLGSSTERTLHLSDGGAGFTTLYVTNGANTLRGIFAVSNSPSTISIGTQTNTDLRLVTNDTERMRITSGGHVGVKITPNSGWGSAMAALQIGTGGVLNNWTGANNNFGLGVNYYDNGAGSQLRLYTGGTSNISFSEDIITFSNAGSNSAGTTISFTERMRITSGGEVGIGATPTSGNRFWVRGSSTSGSDTAIFVQNSTPSTLFSVRNDGIVTKPLQPAFRAGRSTSYSPGALTTIVFNSTGGFGFNVGGHYSTSTGRFTAPISGIYNFTACVIWESVSNGQAMDDGFELKVNGTTAAYSFRRAAYVANTTGIGGYYVDNVTALLNLTAGQYVEIMNRYNLTVHGNANYCYFNGYLVG